MLTAVSPLAPSVLHALAAAASLAEGFAIVAPGLAEATGAAALFLRPGGALVDLDDPCAWPAGASAPVIPVSFDTPRWIGDSTLVLPLDSRRPADAALTVVWRTAPAREARADVESAMATAAALLVGARWRLHAATLAQGEGVRRREAVRLTAIVAAQQAIATARSSPREIMHIMAERARALTGACLAAAGLREDAHVRYAAPSADDPTLPSELTIPLRDTLLGDALREGVVVYCPDVEREARTDAALCRKLGIRSLIHVPVSRDGVAFGVLTIASRETDGFTESDVQSLRLMAELLSAALGRAVDFEQAERLLAERTAAFAALQESETRFTAFMDHTPIFASLKDVAGKFVYVNGRFAQRFGVRATDVLGHGMDTYIAEDIARRTSEGDRRVLETGEVQELEETMTLPDGTTRSFVLYKFPVTDARSTRLVGTVGLDITERKRSQEALRRQSVVFEALHDAVVLTDLEGRVVDCNPAAERRFGYERAEMLGATPALWRPAAQVPAGRWSGEITVRRKSGHEGLFDITRVPLVDDDGAPAGYVEIGRDLTVRRRLEQQLLQAQKLEAIGQLAAGIAHEINTPTQYVSDNVRFLDQAFADVYGMLHEYDGLVDAARAVEPLGARVAALDRARAAADMEFLVREIPQAIQQSLDGLDRIASIVRSVKEFSHPSATEAVTIDLNHELVNTIAVARNEWKYVADMETDLDPALPLIDCHAGELNQVFLNLIVNAAQAIGDVIRDAPGTRGRITITTRAVGDRVEVHIVDTGGGIPEDARTRIFDPFFTTKPVGKGTGQGLAIAHNVVVDKHGGDLRFESEVGRGTTFVVSLPRQAAPVGAVSAEAA